MNGRVGNKAEGFQSQEKENATSPVTNSLWYFQVASNANLQNVIDWIMAFLRLQRIHE
jgi:hypothetical protein